MAAASLLEQLTSFSRNGIRLHRFQMPDWQPIASTAGLHLPVTQRSCVVALHPAVLAAPAADRQLTE
jgi:hypothetical protein